MNEHTGIHRANRIHCQLAVCATLIVAASTVAAERPNDDAVHRSTVDGILAHFDRLFSLGQKETERLSIVSHE